MMRCMLAVFLVMSGVWAVESEVPPVAEARPVIALEPAEALAMAEVYAAEAEGLLKNAQPRLAGERMALADLRLAQIPKAERPALGERYKKVRARLTAVARTLADDPALIPPAPPAEADKP